MVRVFDSWGERGEELGLSGVACWTVYKYFLGKVVWETKIQVAAGGRWKAAWISFAASLRGVMLLLVNWASTRSKLKTVSLWVFPLCLWKDVKKEGGTLNGRTGNGRVIL